MINADTVLIRADLGPCTGIALEFVASSTRLPAQLVMPDNDVRSSGSQDAGLPGAEIVADAGRQGMKGSIATAEEW